MIKFNKTAVKPEKTKKEKFFNLADAFKHDATFKNLIK